MAYKFRRDFWILFVLLFSFSEGKPCPELTRPHLTRCDMYFKCLVLPSKNHVWVPQNCDQGLIYETEMKSCVLPSENWECLLSEAAVPSNQAGNDENIYGINSLGGLSTERNDELSNETNPANLSSDLIVEEAIGNNSISTFPSDSQFNEIVINDYESSGSGPLDDIEMTTFSERKSDSVGMEIPVSSNVDPNLVAQLQRLSQIIDGLKSNYLKKDAPNKELRPDQLNAFLAHYNIKSQFNAIVPSDFDTTNQKISLSESDGSIKPELMQEIIKEQNELNATPHHTANKTKTRDGTNMFMRSPSILQRPAIWPSDERTGYSNSQIVVNRPEGSVVFSLPIHHHHQQQQQQHQQPQEQKLGTDNRSNFEHFHNENDPKISDETLRTVLELSKQMILNQNVRQQMIPQQNYVQPLVQPIYLPYPISNHFDERKSTTKNRFNDRNDKSSTEDDDTNRYEKISSAAFVSKTGSAAKPHTIIQNSVIPVTITSGGEQGLISRPDINSDVPKINSDNFEHTEVDSYGERVPDYIKYPPTWDTNGDTNYNRYSVQNSPSFSDLYTPTPHLNSKNANDLVKLDSYPSVPYSLMPSSAYYPQQQQQQQSLYNNRPPPPPPVIQQIQPSNIQIRPNSFLSASAEFQQQNEIQSDEDIGQQLSQSIINQVIPSLSLTPSSPLPSSISASNNNNRRPLLSTKSNRDNNKQLVNLAGNYISYDLYKNQLLPALGDGNPLTDKIQLITCTTGVRQPNNTDCTRYFVCNPKTRAVLSFTCPPYTGFNGETRICDAKTYSFCNPEFERNTFTISHNKKMQFDALKALQDVKRIKLEALEAQRLAALIQLETQQALHSNQQQNQHQHSYGLQAEFMNSMRDATTPATMLTYLIPTSTTSRIPIMDTTSSLPVQRTRKIYCKDGTKVADDKSMYNYFVCYKTKDGRMHGHKMTCTPGLVFCARTSMCTLKSRCP